MDTWTKIHIVIVVVSLLGLLAAALYNGHKFRQEQRKYRRR